MEFVIVSKTWLNNKSVVIQPEWRHSLDGTEYILHKEMIAPLVNEEDNIKFYRYDDNNFLNIINGDKWVSKQDGEII